MSAAQKNRKKDAAGELDLDYTWSVLNCGRVNDNRESAQTHIGGVQSGKRNLLYPQEDKQDTYAAELLFRTEVRHQLLDVAAYS